MERQRKRLNNAIIDIVVVMKRGGIYISMMLRVMTIYKLTADNEILRILVLAEGALDILGATVL